MRLWHEQMIPLLPKNQLLGQHRECCALRGNGWKKKHKTVDYVFSYSPYELFLYHSLVMDEMEKRGYQVSIEWRDKNYRGKIAEKYRNLEEKRKAEINSAFLFLIIISGIKTMLPPHAPHRNHRIWLF